MAWTISDAISRVREILQDEDAEEYRYTDESLIGVFNVAVLSLREKRPDAFIVGQPITEYTTADLTAEFPVPLTFYTPITYFVAAYAELRDDEFTTGGRAILLMAKFNEDVMGVANSRPPGV